MSIIDSIHLITPNSFYYPHHFWNLTPPPIVLFALGNISLLHTYSIAVIGARACQEESVLFTKQLVNELCSYDITILSGMADGIDQVAHEVCIQNGGKTIAILGSGFKIAKREKIFHRILENDGLILSEYFPDIPAMPYHFPRRNTLLVSIAKKVIAVETHLKSGTMITAQEALQQNVPLYTFPARIYDKEYAGNNLLLSQGAHCLLSTTDVTPLLPSYYLNQKKNTLSKCVPPQFQKLYHLLSDTPQSIQELSFKTSLSIQDLQSQLLQMELENLVCKLSNQQYIKN